jgi:type IV pilus assembly protein PilC
MEFNCRYSHSSGKIERAVHAGQDKADVRRKLEEQGFLPLSIEPRRWLFRPRRSRSAGFKADDFLLFNQQFVALIRAGLPILRSLEILESRIANLALRAHITSVREAVKSGTSLSDALAAREVFPRVYTASVFAGERSGNLVDVINRYVRYQKTLLSAGKKFRNSLIYPAFLVVLSLMMVGVIVAYVIPRFAELYEGLNTALPAPTQILIAVSNTIQSSLVLVLPLLVGILVLIPVWTRSSGGQKRVDRWKLQLPVLGAIWRMFAIAQLSRTLSTLLEGGIPLVSALEVAHESSGNRVIADAIAAGAARVREGMSLADALEGTGRFPELAIEMISVGEQTGSLPEMLNHMADFYDEDLDLRLSALLGWVEPVILIFVASFVAVILISLYLPIFSIGSRGAIT